MWFDTERRHRNEFDKGDGPYGRERVKRSRPIEGGWGALCRVHREGVLWKGLGVGGIVLVEGLVFHVERNANRHLPDRNGESRLTSSSSTT